MYKIAKRTLIILRTCALIAYVPLLFIHFVLKDHFQVFQLPFYAFPLPILIIGGVFITFLYFRPKSYFILGICLTLSLTVIWIHKAYIFPRDVEVPENAISVIFWNAANRATIHLDVLSENIKNIQPDIITLVEAENATSDDILQLSKDFPNYEFRILEGDMLIGIKGKLNQITYTTEPEHYRINLVEAQLNTGPILIALTDTFQEPTMDKKKTLETVLELVSQYNSDIIVGDFNTPFESVHFRKFETDYTSFHEYGQGFTATWPFGIPLLEIDQIFTSKKFTPILLQKSYYKVSDHAMLVGYFN